MRHFRGKLSSSATPTNDLPPTPTSPIEYIRKELATINPRAKDSRALAASTSAIALSIVSSSYDPSDPALDGPGPSQESCWRTAYGAARMAVDIANASSDMFLPLKAVVGVLAVIIKNYDQTTANAEQIKDIEERVQSLAETLTSPVGDRDSEEKARRETLRKRLAEIVAKLGALSEQHGLLKFLKNVDHANTLNGFVQELAYAITDYQTSIQRSIYENTKRINESTRRIDKNTRNMGNIIEAAHLEFLGKLNPVHNAGYQAGHHDTCLQGTRESVLGSIMRWAKDPRDRHVFWLNGLAGTGKSTIAQTFSEMVANLGTLGASFFCSRDYLDRKELKNIFPTLAYQLACRYPAFRSQIIRVIRQDPSVARNSLISQLKNLIVDPLSSTNISCVIIVDALDECVDDQPASAILSVLGRFVKQLPSVKFFITGRPEPRIRTGFRLPLLEPFTQIFLLHEVELSSVDEDIRLYLQEKLTAVAKRRSDFDLSDPWPCDADLMALTKKSSGLFIFASTLARFIESEYHEPNGRLQLIVAPPDSTVHEGRAGIDPLYAQVLMHAFYDVKESMVFTNLRRVLGAVVLAFNPLSRAQIAGILNINTSLITTTLRHLHSVLLVPDKDSKEIRVFHKSFPDFLQDRDRCSDSKFFISSPDHHGDMALGCFGLLKKLKPNHCALPDFVMNRDVADVPKLLERKVGGALRYACGYWAMHVQSSPTTNDHAIRLIASATEFFKNDAVPWIEVMSLENQLEGVIHNINSLFDWLDKVGVSTSNLYSLAEDCLRFTMHFFNLIQQSARHIYHSALPLSPASSMLRSAILGEKVRITGYYGRPDNWGPVVRTIKGASGGFTCMTTIGYRIAAACDGTVGIYDSVTGVLRLSLSPEHPIQAMIGSPDGSILFCTHQDSPLITSWDIQTGGLIHTFALKGEVKDAAISLNGRHLACGLSDGSVTLWEVANKTASPAFGSGSPITHLCWLAPEELLVVANEASVHIWDVAVGGILHSFTMRDPVCGVAYSKLNDLAIVTSSAAESAITIINPQTGTSSTSYRIQRRLCCFAFSKTTNKLMCGMKTHGLQLFDVSTRRWRHFDHPATITSVSAMSNGIAVANATGSGIQLLSLDEEYAPSRQPIASALAVYTLDEDRIIAIVPNELNRVILVEQATMSRVLTIPAQTGYSIPTDRTVILCTSHENHMAVHCFEEGAKGNLQLWKFASPDPQWTVATWEVPSIGGISPTGSRLVTYHKGRYQTYVYVWDVENGKPQAKLLLKPPLPGCPLEITFESEDRFCFRYDNYLIPFVISSSKSGTPNHSINRRRQLSLVRQVQRKQYDVDDNREWVVSGSKRICWIPPGYIRSVQAGYCWAGSSLVMAGQDGTLRKLTFQ
ncbi:hypothetical protein BDM02DRAFT_927883 [Thelephora ganbajun]|uniref:Uncharacterized protein n=1 Tax=Thelephora ganbajun TaxID=370292 RepID=A0ACB6Z4Q3_THEGA|nr:hypothetical protein BDM02DRAFT_927883 [Thelephora ganbajun]